MEQLLHVVFPFLSARAKHLPSTERPARARTHVNVLMEVTHSAAARGAPRARLHPRCFLSSSQFRDSLRRFSHLCAHPLRAPQPLVTGGGLLESYQEKEMSFPPLRSRPRCYSSTEICRCSSSGNPETELRAAPERIRAGGTRSGAALLETVGSLRR